MPNYKPKIPLQIIYTVKAYCQYSQSFEMFLACTLGINSQYCPHSSLANLLPSVSLNKEQINK